MKFLPVVFAYLCLFCLGFLDNSRGPIYPSLLQHFNINTDTGSLIFVGSSFSAFVLSFYASRIIKRFGLINPSIFGLIFYGLAALLIGISPANNFGIIMLICGSSFLGIGVGIHSVSLNLIITYFSSLDKRRKLFAGLHSMYGLASLLAPLAIGLALKLSLSWQHYFLAIGTLFITLALILSFIPIAKYSEGTKNVEKAGPKNSVMVPAAVMMASYVSAEVLVSSRLVLFLTESNLSSKAESLELLSLFFLFLLAGRLSFAFFTVPLKSRTLLSISNITSLFLVIIGINGSPIAMSLAGLSMSYFFPCAMDFLGEYFEENEMDIGFSRVMIIVGGTLAFIHLAFGQITTHIGIESSILIIPVFLIIVMYILHVHLPFLAKRKKLANY